MSAKDRKYERTELEKEDKTEKVIEISAKDYLKKEFPLLKNIECKIDFNFLWGDDKNKYYRINFWAKRENDKRELSWLKDNYINRSHFVKLIKDRVTWKHEIEK